VRRAAALPKAGVAEPDLAARVESALEREKARLAEDLGHYALVFPVEQAQLLAFMRRVRIFGSAHQLVLGTAQGFEPHGGGLLALLLDLWRPEGRAAKLDDRFAFEASGATLPLSAIYASHRSWIFLRCRAASERSTRSRTRRLRLGCCFACRAPPPWRWMPTSSSASCSSTRRTSRRPGRTRWVNA
jgi:hypothetical protein